MSSTFLAGSADSASGSSEPECELSPSARSIPIAEKFSGSIGRRPQSAKTSGQWRLTEPQKIQATDLYEQGHSIGKIAALFKVSRQGMWDVLRRRTQMRDRIAALPRKEPTAIRNKRLKALRRYRSRAARISRPQIRVVLERDKVCRTCGNAAKDIDHIIPVSRGGQTELSNLQLLCRPCHHQKSRQDRRAG
jgi:5-methylcytosine-specific restriction endonuclease McrA